ncbi:MAG: RNA polymerase sigma factor [Gemmataceae bacterium]
MVNEQQTTRATSQGAEKQLVDARESDGQLLETYLAQQDEEAFAALVRRHGPMVLGVCRRILRHFHDAEDAFQATFLVLVRRADSIVPRENVGLWLYGVASRTALKAKTKRQHRLVKEQEAQPATSETDRSTEHREVQEVLAIELAHLPEKYRSALLLCDMQGKTQVQAAKELGIPEGTIATRLFRGRKLLADRLTRHGVALSIVGYATLWAQQATTAAVPELLETTTQNAFHFAAGRLDQVPSQVTDLTKTILQAATGKKLQLLAVVGLVLLCLCLGWWFGRGRATLPHGDPKSIALGQEQQQSRGGDPSLTKRQQDGALEASTETKLASVEPSPEKRRKTRTTAPPRLGQKVRPPKPLRPVNGMSLELSVDARSIEPNKTIKFELRFKNHTDDIMVISVVPQKDLNTTQSALQTGELFERVPMRGNKKPIAPKLTWVGSRLVRQAPEQSDMVLDPNSTVVIPVFAKFDSSRGLVFGHVGGVHEKSVRRLVYQLPWRGKEPVTLRAGYSYTRRETGRWTGTVVSNPITLQTVPGEKLPKGNGTTGLNNDVFSKWMWKFWPS